VPDTPPPVALAAPIAPNRDDDYFLMLGLCMRCVINGDSASVVDFLNACAKLMSRRFLSLPAFSCVWLGWLLVAQHRVQPTTQCAD
jgi:hypothetical protein